MKCDLCTSCAAHNCYPATKSFEFKVLLPKASPIWTLPRPMRRTTRRSCTDVREAVWCRDRDVSRLISRLLPTSKPSLLGPSLSRASYHIPLIPDCTSLFWTILVSSGNYSSCLNIHFPPSCALFLSDIAVVIRPYNGLHHLFFSYHWAPASLIGLTGDSSGTHTWSVSYLIYPL